HSQYVPIYWLRHVHAELLGRRHGRQRFRARFIRLLAAGDGRGSRWRAHCCLLLWRRIRPRRIVTWRHGLWITRIIWHRRTADLRAASPAGGSAGPRSPGDDRQPREGKADCEQARPQRVLAHGGVLRWRGANPDGDASGASERGYSGRSAAREGQVWRKQILVRGHRRSYATELTQTYDDVRAT